MRFALLFSFFFFLFIPAARAQTITGKIIAVDSGDSLILESADHKRIEIALHGIDAPEINQAYGHESREYLSRLVLGRGIRFITISRDKLGRLTGTVMAGDRNLNTEMVRRGFAWCYKKTARRKPSLYVKLMQMQQRAKKEKIGLWSARHPVPPWEWRKIWEKPHPVKEERCDCKI